MSARDPLVLAPDTLNHVTQRATDREIFCFDRLDRDGIVGVVARTVDRHDLTLVDYCVMTNHVHLILAAPHANLPKAMQYLWARVVERFNRRHCRRGHLVQAPYRAKPIESEEHYLAARAYVAMNPVEAGLCEKPEDWRWSGYGGRGALVPPPDSVIRRLVQAQLAERAARPEDYRLPAVLAYLADDVSYAGLVAA
jgi:REP element-mobilizing transposase RayT